MLLKPERKEKAHFRGEEKRQFIIEKCDYGDYQSEARQKTTTNNSWWKAV